MHKILGVFSFLLLATYWPAVARAETPVDLELALAVDVSRSVDLNEARLQREGYIEAFRDPEVIRAIASGFLGRIAVSYYEWAGFSYNKVVVGWTLIDGPESAHAFSDSLRGNLPQSARRTSISEAIAFAVPWFEGNGFEGTRRVVDISGDGPNNWGDLVTSARDRALAAGITINGLPILNHEAGIYGRYNIPNLDLYYRDCVIGGAGAFIVVASNFADFARAVRRKLILEIAGAGVVPRRSSEDGGRTKPAAGAGVVPRRSSEDGGRTKPAAGARPIDGARLQTAQAGPAARVPPPCDIGEQILRNRDDF